MSMTRSVPSAHHSQRVSLRPEQWEAQRPLLLLLAHRAVNPPPSSPLAEERTPLLSPLTWLAPLAEAGVVSRCLPLSLADEERVCSLDRPGQRRVSLAPCGGARFPTLAAYVPEHW
jgi:hypothetical protein